MKLADYYYGLSDADKTAFAKALPTSREYIRVHLIPEHRKPDRNLRFEQLAKIPEITNNQVSLAEVFEHFSDREEVAA